MKKKFAILLAGVIALSSFAIGAMSKNVIEKIEAEIRGDFTVVIDGEKQTFRDVDGNIVEPILYEGTTYLPIRAIGEIMGKTVYWYQEEKRIELVTPSENEPLVTDADVIVDGTEKTAKDIVKPEKTERTERTEKVEKPTENVKITLEEAKEAVLKKAGLKESEAVFTKAELDYDDGRVVYEIEFKTDTAKYDATVDATTGEITEWEVEEIKAKTVAVKAEAEITLEEAKAIALKKAGLKESEVVFKKAKLEHEGGRAIYEIEFKKDRVEYEAEIDASDGTIIEWKVDNH